MKVRFILFFLLGASISFFITKSIYLKPDKKPVQQILQNGDFEKRAGQSQFVNPLLECGQNINQLKELSPFKKTIISQIEDLKAKNQISEIAVYFRDLNNGPWFGIDEQNTFSPASLLKVPLAIAYYKLAEADSSLLDKQYTFKESYEVPNVIQSVLPSDGLKLGQAYTVRELIYRMLKYSDNQAYAVLVENIDFKDLIHVYKDFGIDLSGSGDTEEIVSVQSYSAFFRILYNASYLNKTDSEILLSILSESSFRSALVAAVPENILVSHKFGERGVQDSSDRQFSDCGIVYYPSNPYLICVMTKGQNLDQQIKAVKSISGLVYKEVDAQKNNK